MGRGPYTFSLAERVTH